MESRSRRDGWAPRSSAQEAPRATSVNFGRGARMWGGDPGPHSRLLGPAPPGSVVGRGGVGGLGLGLFRRCNMALPVRHLLRGRGYFCPPAGARAGKGARCSAALGLGASPRAVAVGRSRAGVVGGGSPRARCWVCTPNSAPGCPCKMPGSPPHLTRVGVAISLGNRTLESLHFVTALKPFSPFGWWWES